MEKKEPINAGNVHFAYPEGIFVQEHTLIVEPVIIQSGEERSLGNFTYQLTLKEPPAPKVYELQETLKVDG